jgi:hypothetical protein
MRNRYRGTTFGPYYKWTKAGNPPVAKTFDYTGVFPYGVTQSMSDVVTAKFTRKRNSGDVICSPMTTSRINKQSSTVEVASPFGAPLYTVSGHLAAACAYTAGSGRYRTLPANAGRTPEEDRYFCLVKAYAKMNSTPVKTLPMLGESMQTFRMLRSPMRGLVKLLKRAVKRNKRALKKLATSKKTVLGAKTTAETWLEYRYGLMPLLMDINGTFVAAFGTNPWKSMRRVARHGVTQQYALPPTGGVRSLGYGDVSYLVSDFVNYQASAGVIYDVVGVPGSLDDIQQQLGLTYANAPSAVWELLPYSFVVDWFICVSDWLEAIRPRADIKVLSSWSTVWSREVHEYKTTSCKFTNPYAGGKAYYVPAETDWLYESISIDRRAPVSLMGLPPMRDFGLSSNHILDGTALLAQKILNNLRQLRH